MHPPDSPSLVLFNQTGRCQQPRITSRTSWNLNVGRKCLGQLNATKIELMGDCQHCDLKIGLKVGAPAESQTSTEYEIWEHEML